VKYLKFMLGLYVVVMAIFAIEQLAFGQMRMTNDEWKHLLMEPGPLFIVMLCGSFGSMLNQMVLSKRAGIDYTYAQYLSHWPEIITMMIGNTFAFITLLLADQLNFAAAVGIGWIANSVSDQFTRGGRSSELKAAPEEKKV